MLKAVIMAGGEGTRLRPLTSNRPKPMIPVLNRPMVEHMIRHLRKYGVTDIVMSLFYLPDNVQNYFGDGSEWDVSLKYSVEETALGTAGGVRKAAGDWDDTLIVLSGDGIINFNLDEILKYHREKNSPFTIVLTRVKKPTDYGIVITGPDGRVEKFLEKPSWGEVFSDTVNTGTYIIEPHILNTCVPPQERFDFSLDLFPLLEERGIPIYGYISEGYWCDVGTLNAYTEVHRHILDGAVGMDIQGKKIGKDIWVGKDVDIHPESIINGPAYIGNFVKIKKGAMISDSTVIGDNCIVEENASVKRGIILHSTIIGPRCEIRGAIIGKRCVLQEGVAAYEGSVISDDCRVGMGVEIPAGIRVWPDKMIEQGTRLTTDLIWGEREKKTLFSSDGISGIFNVKITPEFASKLGSAVGAFLGKNSTVVISRDPTSAARLIQRAFEAGLLSMGVDVYDMEVESVPLNRYSVRYMNADMGVYIQISPASGLQFIQIQLFNRYGYQLGLCDEKKIENIFFRGDYPRKDAFETGRILYPAHYIESYIHNMTSYIDPAVLKARRWNLIVDCYNGTGTRIFPDMLNYAGCDATILRGQIKEFDSEEATRHETRKALRNIIKMSRISREIGVMLGPHGTQVIIIDEMGNIVTPDHVSAILSMYYLRHCREKIINLPVTAPRGLESLVRQNGGEVVHVSTRLRVPDKVTDIFMPSDGGRHPYLEQSYDPMITFLRILMYLTLEKSTLFEAREKIPRSNMITSSIPCQMDEKASVMRYITTSVKTGYIELIDGVRVTEDKSWILILPDSVQPFLHIFAEGDTSAERDRIVDEYVTRISQFKNTMC